MAREKNVVKTLGCYYKGDDICAVDIGRVCFGINDFIESFEFESETTDEVGIITAFKVFDRRVMAQILIPYEGLQWRPMAIARSDGSYLRLWRHRRED